MTDHTISIRGLLAALALLALTACTEDNRNDYCRNHYNFHPDHADDIAQLEVKIQATGKLFSRVTLPAYLSADSSIPDRLKQESALYTLQADQECLVLGARQSDRDGIVALEFESDCGADNRLRQVDVKLLDSLPELEEVEVVVTTPATQKHFAISRQCAAPIFRLQRPGG